MLRKFSVERLRMTLAIIIDELPFLGLLSKAGSLILWQR